MPNNLGEISELKKGLDGIWIFVDSYKKIKKVTKAQNIYLEAVLKYYEDNMRILENLKKKFGDLK